MTQEPSQKQQQPTKKADGGLLRSSGVVSFFTMLSRFMGLARDIIFARVIGAEALADVFFVAFKIPNFLSSAVCRGGLCSGICAGARGISREGQSGGLKGTDQSGFRYSGFISSCLTLVVVLAAPLLAALFAPKWYLNDPFKFNATAEMLRITFPYLLFISMTGVAGGY